MRNAPAYARVRRLHGALGDGSRGMVKTGKSDLSEKSQFINRTCKVFTALVIIPGFIVIIY